jgi:hypothetical protein
MSQIAIIKLIDSMSKEEKRKFKLSTKKQFGKKDYLELFNLIDKGNFTDFTALKETFKQLHPQTSLDNTARYLLKVLTDSLIQTKIKEDNSFYLQYGLLRVALLQARSLGEEAYKELIKLKALAIKSQNKIIQFIIFREELNYLSSLNFVNLREKELIDTQIKILDLLKDIRNTHEHYSLYEVLKYRLVHSGNTLPEEGGEKLNDLILNEMSLISGRGKKNFQSQKLHLLFQSFFFTHIGDYKSALKSFYVLNNLFEQNTTIWNSPPIDYFSSLDGIMDSLRAIGLHEEMDFYIKKMKKLDYEAYPEFFRVLVKKTIMIYQLFVFLSNKKFDEGVAFIVNTSPGLLNTYSRVDDEKQSELLFYISLTYFKANKLKKAQKYINEIILIGKINFQSIIYKAARLLSILIHYESNDLEYLDYEIRSYKRATQGKMKFLKTEVVIFKAVKLHPDKNIARKNEILWKKLLPTIKSIEKNKYEMQLGKYFDFIGWVQNKFLKPVRQ